MTGDGLACRLLEMLVADMRPYGAESASPMAHGLPTEPIRDPERGGQ